MSQFSVSIAKDSEHHSFPSTTDQPKIIPSHFETTAQKQVGELYLITHQQEKQQIIDQYIKHHSSLCSHSVICIRSPEDFNRHGLLHQLRVEHGELQKSIGYLFGDKPMTLIIDLTIMLPEEIPRINDILQTPASCNGQQLGPNIKRVILANKHKIAEEGISPDLFRRLNAMEIKTTPNGLKNTLTDQELLAKIFTKITPHSDSIPNEINTITVDLAGIENWHHELFGGIILNEEGRFIYSPGALTQLNTGISLLLKNAPWDNILFEAEMAMTFRQEGFESNHSWIKLPDHPTLFRKEVSIQELDQWKHERLHGNHQFNPKLPYITINASTIRHLKGTFRLEGYSIVKTNQLANLVGNCNQIVITSPLQTDEWLWLLNGLESLASGHKPALFDNPSLEKQHLWQQHRSCRPADENSTRIFYELSSLVADDVIDSTAEIVDTVNNHQWQHQVFGGILLDEEGNFAYSPGALSKLNSNNYLVLKDHLLDSVDFNAALVTAECEGGFDRNDNAWFSYDVSSVDSMDSFVRVSMDSKQDFIFSTENTPLMERLVQGLPVTLRGLENNPELAEQLQSLSTSEPYLFVNGHKKMLSKVRVHVKPPVKNLTTKYLLFDQRDQNQQHQTYPTGETILELIKALPACCDKSYPAKPPWDNKNFDQLFNKQTEIERIHDGSNQIQPHHKRRALHSLLAKAYRGNKNVYSFIKAKIAQHFPDSNNETTIDRSALLTWLLKHPDPTQTVLREEFWQLARYCPADVHHSISTLHKVNDLSVKHLAHYLASIAPSGLREKLIDRFRVNPPAFEETVFYDGTILSTLRDAFISERNKLLEGVEIHHSVKKLWQEIQNLLLEQKEGRESLTYDIQCVDLTIEDNLFLSDEHCTVGDLKKKPSLPHKK